MTALLAGGKAVTGGMGMLGVFDVVGPVMIGPSSSHTAGAVRLGRMARAVLADRPVAAEIYLHGSFAQTGKGHGTDLAIIAGILGLKPDDESIVRSKDLAAAGGLAVSLSAVDLGFAHPNTAKIIVRSANGKEVTLTGASVGGGNILVSRINNFDVHLTGEHYTVCVAYQDQLGMVAQISQLLAEGAINIASMHVSREERQCRALMVVETDDAVPAATVAAIGNFAEVDTVFILEPVID